MLSLYNLSKIFQVGAEKRSAIKNITLSIKEGDLVSITGPSGSGKTTLLEILSLISRPTFGKYLFGDTETSLLDDSVIEKLRSQKIGCIFQHSNFIDELTIYQNLELPLLYQGVSALQRREKVSAALNFFHLADYEFAFPPNVGSSVLNKLSVARALIHDPGYIMADEPTGNLDSITTEEVMAILQRLHEDGKTVIFATHDIDIARHAKRVICLRDGVVTKDVNLANPIISSELLKKMRGN